MTDRSNQTTAVVVTDHGTYRTIDMHTSASAEITRKKSTDTMEQISNVLTDLHGLVANPAGQDSVVFLPNS